MLSDLKHETFASLRNFDLESVKNLRKLFVELNVDNGSDDLGDFTGAHGSSRAAKGTRSS
jgi:hypothetical protein